MTSNSSLKVGFRRALLLAPTYMACTTLTNYSGTPTKLRAHYSTFQGTLLKEFSRSTNAICYFVFCEIVLLKVSKNRNCICCTLICNRFVMFYRIFLSTQVKRSAIISNKHGMCELLHELPKNLRLIIIGF